MKETIKMFLPRLNINTLMSIALSITFFLLFIILGAIELKGSLLLIILYGFSHLFLLWTIFEITLKKIYQYSLFLLFMGIPLQNWLVRTENAWNFTLHPIVINYISVVMLILIISFLHSHKKNIRINYKTSLIFSAVLTIAIISLLNSKNVYITTNGILYGLIVPFLVYFLTINLVRKKRDMIVLYQGIVISLFIYNIVNYILEGTLLGHSNRLSGIFGNPNFYAPILLVSAFLSLFLLYYFKVNQKKISIIYLMSFILSLYLLLSVGSRTVFVTFLIGLILFYFQLPNTNKKITVPLILSIAFIIGFMYFDLGSIVQDSSFSTIKRLLLTYETGLSNARSEIWSDSLNYIIENNLMITGVGFGVLLFDEIGWTTSHNSFLYLSMTIGIIGSILYHYIIIKNINISRLFKRNLDMNISGIIIVILFIQMSITGYRILLYSTSEIQPNMSVHLDVIYLWLLIGISSASRSFRNNE